MSLFDFEIFFFGTAMLTTPSFKKRPGGGPPAAQSRLLKQSRFYLQAL